MEEQNNISEQITEDIAQWYKEWSGGSSLRPEDKLEVFCIVLNRLNAAQR